GGGHVGVHQARILLPLAHALADEDEGRARPRLRRGAWPAGGVSSYQSDSLRRHDGVDARIRDPAGAGHPALAAALDGRDTGILDRRLRRAPERAGHVLDGRTRDVSGGEAAAIA